MSQTEADHVLWAEIKESNNGAVIKNVMGQQPSDPWQMMVKVSDDDDDDNDDINKNTTKTPNYAFVGWCLIIMHLFLQYLI